MTACACAYHHLSTSYQLCSHMESSCFLSTCPIGRLSLTNNVYVGLRMCWYGSVCQLSISFHVFQMTREELLRMVSEAVHGLKINSQLQR